MKRALARCLLAFMLLMLAGIAPTGAAIPHHPTRWPDAPVWSVRCIDCPASYFVLNERGLALDSAGQPAIAYTAANSSELRYAWRSGGAWAVQVVRQGWQTAAHPSLALDGQNRPRLAFYDPAWRHLRLAWGEPFGIYLPLAARSQ